MSEGCELVVRPDSAGQTENLYKGNAYFIIFVVSWFFLAYLMRTAIGTRKKWEEFIWYPGADLGLGLCF